MSPPPDPFGPTETESRDSVFAEVSTDNIDFTPRPVRDDALRHAPDHLRKKAEALGLIPPRSGDPLGLADCLLEQARVLVKLRRFAEAVPRVAEAEQAYQQIGTSSGLAAAYRVAAEVHQELGDLEKALDYLRKEEELRRRFAA